MLWQGEAEVWRSVWPWELWGEWGAGQADKDEGQYREKKVCTTKRNFSCFIDFLLATLKCFPSVHRHFIFMLREWPASYLQTCLWNNSNCLSMVFIFTNMKVQYPSAQFGVKVGNMLPLPSFPFFLTDCEVKQRCNVLCTLGRVWEFLIQCKHSKLIEKHPEY